MAKIIIKNLGPVSSYEMDIKRFNLFIGEQAIGKSTICKAVYFFRIIKDELIRYFYNLAIYGKQEKNEYTLCKSIFIDLFGYSRYMPDDLHLEYYYKEDISIIVSIAVSNAEKYMNISFSRELKSILEELKKEMYAYHNNIKSFDESSFAETENLRLHQELTEKINIIFNDDLKNYYIPAGRCLLTLMTNQKTRLNYDEIDLINTKFMQFIETIQSKFDKGISEVHNYYPKYKRNFDVKTVSQEIIKNLKGEYICSRGYEYLRFPKTKEKVPINFISSGQQEVLWLLNQIYVLMLRNEKSFVIIEEPEAHLYPVLQKYIMSFISRFMNITGSTVIITTHSPYILTCANNLLYAGRLRSSNKAEEIEKITGKYNYILPDEVNAFKLLRNEGKTEYKNLIDNESKEIASELIDEVSEIINQDYTKLFYLENKNEN